MPDPGDAPETVDAEAVATPKPTVEPAPTPTPEPEPQPEPQPEPEPAEDPRIGELEAERGRLAARVAELEAAAESRDGMLRDRSEAAAQAERDRDEASRALQAVQADRDEVLGAWGREKLMGAILEALKGLEFSGDQAAADFLGAVQGKVQAERRPDGAWVARGHGALTLADVVRAEADRRPYMFRATSRGGSDTRGGFAPLAPPPPPPGSFEAIRARFKSQR